MAMSDAQRERVMRYQAQREQYLASRARDLRGHTGGTGTRIESRAKIRGHALHPMLIVFPLGLLATAVIFDLIHLYTGNRKWAEISFYTIAAGIIGCLVAAVPGLIDWAAIPGGTRAKAIGLWHGVGNVIVIGLFAASWVIRQDRGAEPSTIAIVLSFAGVALALLTGWLGGELVDRMGVGIDRGADVDSPGSFSGRPASASVDGDEAPESQRAHA